jgi:pimeloyl-ACP methyl ester carboxylesterase
MDNKVVTITARAFQGAGIATVRFNFRGVGASEGSFDDGRGETEDALAVADWTVGRWPKARLSVAGFSFGAFVAFQVASRWPVERLYTIAPPVRRFDFTTHPVPPVPWLYEYAWPSDCLAMRFVMPQPVPPATAVPLMTNTGIMNWPRVTTSLPFVPAIDLDANGNQIKVILTNACRAQGVYTARIPNVDLWDASLQNAVIGALAAWMCLPVTGDKALMQMRVQLAVGLIQAARISDGNEGITSTDHEPDFMRARNAGLAFGNTLLAGGPFIAGWDSWGGPDGMSY